MSKITESARGQDCNIRIYPYCNESPETTVFCHAPCEDKGTAYKSPDWWGSYGCSTCHDIVDGRMQTDIYNSEIKDLFIAGVYRTQKMLIGNGLIVIK